MSDKKDPGKFTVRFNIKDPQQLAAVELLNEQGRCKAQFITNAILFYVHAAAKASQPGSAIFQHMIMDSQAKYHETMLGEKSERIDETEQDTKWNHSLGDADMDSIRKTMDAFHSI